MPIPDFKLNETLIEKLTRIGQYRRESDGYAELTLIPTECASIVRLATAARDVIMNPEDRTLREELAAALVGLGNG